MAASLTNIASEIQKLSGVTSADTGFIESAQKYIVSHVSKDYMWTYANQIAESSVNPVVLPTFSDSILSVTRKDSKIVNSAETLSGNTYNCDKVSQSTRGYLTDNDSLYAPTPRHPKYIHENNNKVSVFPVPTSDAKVNLYFVDYRQIGDTSDLKSVVVYFAVSSEFTKLAIAQIVDWSDIALPNLPSSPDFGDALSITATVPSIPSITKSEISTSGWAVPTFTKPILTVPDLPSDISWVFPASPVAPYLSSTSVADFDSAAPSFLEPTGSALDFASSNTFIENEDPEMAQARIGEMQVKVSDFSSKLQKSVATFNKENTIYQAKIQEAVTEAQLTDGAEARKLQKYQAEVSDYQAEVNQIIQANNGKFNHWNGEFQQKIGKFSAELGASVNDFNRDNAEFQATVQKSIQDAQLDSQEDAQKLQKFSAEIQKYQAEVQEDVNVFSANLGLKNQEYQANIAQFQQSLSRTNAEVQQRTQKVQKENTNIQAHTAMADKYYQWAIMDLDRYIKNNQRTSAKMQVAQAGQ